MFNFSFSPSLLCSVPEGCQSPLGKLPPHAQSLPFPSLSLTHTRARVHTRAHTQRGPSQRENVGGPRGEGGGGGASGDTLQQEGTREEGEGRGQRRTREPGEYRERRARLGVQERASQSAARAHGKLSPAHHPALLRGPGSSLDARQPTEELPLRQHTEVRERVKVCVWCV